MIPASPSASLTLAVLIFCATPSIQVECDVHCQLMQSIISMMGKLGLNNPSGDQTALGLRSVAGRELGRSLGSGDPATTTQCYPVVECKLRKIIKESSIAKAISEGRRVDLCRKKKSFRDQKKCARAVKQLKIMFKRLERLRKKKKNTSIFGRAFKLLEESVSKIL